MSKIQTFVLAELYKCLHLTTVLPWCPDVVVPLTFLSAGQITLRLAVDGLAHLLFVLLPTASQRPGGIGLG